MPENPEEIFPLVIKFLMGELLLGLDPQTASEILESVLILYYENE